MNILERTTWLCRCVWRLKHLYADGATLPCGDRCLTWTEYNRLMNHILAEYREEA